MSVVVYAHPLRTIWMEWHHQDDGVAVVTGYGNQDPDAQVPDHDVLILHSDTIHSHHYPDPRHDAERCLAEVEAFLPEIKVSDASIRVIPSSVVRYDASWTTLLAWSNEQVKRHSQPSARVLTDIEADLVLLRHEGPTLFAGHRGSTWWCGAINGDIMILDRFQHDDDIITTISSYLRGLEDVGGVLTLFGDTIQPHTVAQFTEVNDVPWTQVRRGEPFRHVHSALTDEQERSVLQRSHLLGCMVAPMLTRSELPNVYTIHP